MLRSIARTVAASLAVAVCTASESGAPSGSPHPAVGKTVLRATDLRLQGFRRTYRLHIPPQSGSGPLPLLVVLHGAFSTAREMERWSGFNGLADREAFYVAYPNGGFSLFGFLQHWNAGHCCGRAARLNVDDVGFVARVIEDIAAAYAVDRERIYVSGLSNGGMLAYRFAAERPSTVAAVAVVAGSIGGRLSAQDPEWRIPVPALPVPAIVLHGLDDDSVPFAGGRSPAKPGSTREYVSVPESVAFWVRHNGCSRPDPPETSFDGAVTRFGWRGGRDGSEVLLVTLAGWPHQWPGGALTARLPAGAPLRTFDAAPVIWDFLSRHRRAAPPASAPQAGTPGAGSPP